MHPCSIASITLVVCGLTALIITLIATSVHRVETNNIGVFFDTLGKEFGPVHNQGLWSWRPFSKVITYTAVYEPVDLYVTCVTNDGLQVSLNASFQYVPQPESVISITERFQNGNEFLGVVTTAATAAIHQTCSRFLITDYQNSRPIIQSQLSLDLDVFLKNINASALAVQLTNVAVPNDWNQAVYNKQQAQQDIVLAQNQRSQIIYLAQNNVSLALQDAEVTQQNADANITVIQLTAQQQALAIESQYQSFTVVCQTLMHSLNITIDGLVSLLTNRVIGNTQGALDVALQTTL